MKLRTIKYFAEEAVKNLRKNISLSTLITIGISMLVMGALILTLLNLVNIGNTLASRIEIRAYMNDSVREERINEIRREIATIEGVERISFLDKDTALKDFIKKQGIFKDVIDILGDNPLPHSFIILLEDPGDAGRVSGRIASIDGIEDVSYGEGYAERIIDMTRFTSVFSLVISLMLILAVAFVIGNIVRLKIYSRDREIEIMRLVGATDWFIRWPFLIEGFLIGLLPSLAVSLILFIFYLLIVTRLGEFLGFLPLISDVVTILKVCGSITLLGGATGFSAGLISLIRYTGEQ